MTTLELVLALGIPTVFISGIVGLGFKYVERRAATREANRQKREEEREANREDSLYQLFKGIDVSIDLCEATARAVRDGHCNGEVTCALSKLDAYKAERQIFYNKQSSRVISDRN